MELIIRSFKNEDQKEARQLILSGLGEHFGFIDESLNPDLDDIESHYINKGNIFVVAVANKVIIGTGALLLDAVTGHIVRVSVNTLYRRQGIGREIVQNLLKEAKYRELKKVIVVTEHKWTDAVGFYISLGFIEYKRDDVDVSMVLFL